LKIYEVAKYLDGNILVGKDQIYEEVDYGYGCDLMSDVLAFVKNNVLLLTGLIHPQVIRTAEMLDIKAIVIVRGKIPGDDFIDMAKRRDIAIITTKHSLYTSCAILYQHGLCGEEIAHNDFKVQSGRK